MEQLRTTHQHHQYINQAEEEAENRQRSGLGDFQDGPTLFDYIHKMELSQLELYLEKLHLSDVVFSDAGKPALHLAIRSRPVVVLPLIRAGCGVMTPDKVHLDTPLHVACFYGLLEVILILVHHGAYINAMNISGQTPLDKLLMLCRQPAKDSTTRSRLLLSHLLSRIGFKINPRAEGQNPGTRRRILHSYRKAKKCSECPSLMHIARLQIRESLPALQLEPAVKSLELPLELQDFLLFKPRVLDRHVICSHVKRVVKNLKMPSVVETT